MTAPVVKGWCPGAHKPMMSGDGLVVRVRPQLSRVSPAQAHELCALSREFGTGELQLTNRANVQIRGLRPEDHETILERLAEVGLLDGDPDLESRRNIVVAGDSTHGDLSERLAAQIAASLGRFPALPAKFGFAVDCGAIRRLCDAPADIRLELGTDGVLVRPDGYDAGRLVDEADAIEACIELSKWFVARRREEKRMAQLVAEHKPGDTYDASPAASFRPLVAAKYVVGAAFGAVPADSLEALLHATSAASLRITPERLIVIEEPHGPCPGGFITEPEDPRLRIDACIGTPRCASATVETRNTALQLAGRTEGRVHVSGCSKGCARPGAADLTLVGRDGRFDVVYNGKPWDAPQHTGLSVADVMSIQDRT